jgi:hypothetical protein
MPDGFEVANGLNPKVNDALLDPDGDGQNNVAEFRAGTNPQSANSSLRVQSIRNVGANNWEVVWSAVPGKKYVIEHTADLKISYSPLPGTNTASGATAVITNTTGGAAGFYRVKLAE